MHATTVLLNVAGMHYLTNIVTTPPLSGLQAPHFFHSCSQLSASCGFALQLRCSHVTAISACKQFQRDTVPAELAKLCFGLRSVTLTSMRAAPTNILTYPPLLPLPAAWVCPPTPPGSCPFLPLRL